MIKIAVCEDEVAAMDTLVSKIRGYLAEKQRVCAIATFVDGESLLQDIAAHNRHYDAIYLDIQMHQINGIDTAKAIRKTDDKTCIVFVTALSEYVYDAFDVNATNYLVKPIDDQKLCATLDKIVAQIDFLASRYLVIREQGTIEKVPFANIIYCEVLNHRIFVYESNCMHAYGGKIEELEKALSEEFFRCHRSYIIHFAYVEKYIDGFAYLTSGEKIPIATRRRQEFMQALLRFQRKEVR